MKNSLLKLNILHQPLVGLVASIVLLTLPVILSAQAPYIGVPGYSLASEYQFGTNSGNNVQSIADLKRLFMPDARWGRINQELQHFVNFLDVPYGNDNVQPDPVAAQRTHQFESEALVLNSNHLGGEYVWGNIESGAIVSRETVKRPVIIEFLVKQPKGRAHWPALWLYNYHSQDTTSDEIDILESQYNAPIGQRDDRRYVYQNTHGEFELVENFEMDQWGRYNTGVDMSEDYHYYSCHWHENGDVDMYVDGVLTVRRNIPWREGDPSIIAMLSTGSESVDWPGPIIDDSTNGTDTFFPDDPNSTLKIRHLRIFKPDSYGDGSETIGINCGGPAYTDAQGRVFAADNYATGGTTTGTGNAIAGTTEDTLYQTGRYHTSSFEYQIPVSATADYVVTLKFAETYFNSSNSRVFDVIVEGNTTQSNVDLYALAGHDVAYDMVTTATVEDGVLNITFPQGDVNNAYVTAIYVEKLLEHDYVTLDSENSTGITLTGSWTPSTNSGGYAGANYLHDNNESKGSKSVEYTPTLASSGSYEVLLRWTSFSNRATNVPVTIVLSDGSTTTVTVDQTVDGGKWVSLGFFDLSTSNASVTISNTGTNGVVIADAVRFDPPNAGGGGVAQFFEVEDILDAISTDTSVIFSDSAASGGTGEKLNSDSVGDFIDYAVPVTVAGSYDVLIGQKTYTGRGEYQLSVDGVNVGSPQNQYAYPGGYEEVNVGTTSFTTPGNKSFRFTVTSNGGSSGYNLAFDYIKLEPIATSSGTEVTMDSEDSSGVALNGSWSASTSAAGYLGSNYLHDGNANKGSKSVVYTPALSAADDYEVFMRWTAFSNRATNVPVDIVRSDGSTTTVTVDQTQNNNQWMSLGVYSLSPSNASVTIRTTGTNGVVIADGMRFTP